MKNEKNREREKKKKVRLLRFENVDWWSDSNEFELRLMVRWKKMKKGLNEEFEKSDIIKCIRMNGCQFVGM